MSIEGVYLVAGLRFHRSIPSFIEAVEQAFLGGVRLFQLRVKDDLSDKEHLELSLRVRELAYKYHVTYILNDRPDLAMQSHADGVHLGPDDMSVQEARSIIGDKIIGKSSHSYAQAQKALEEKISYLSVGPVFETDCKEVPDHVVGIDLLTQILLQAQGLPIVAIGGIELNNLYQIAQTGVGCFGLIRGIMQAENIHEEAEKYVHEFGRLQKDLK
ncbi:MAG: thiamine phosphate synthase [SAR324 cluster bacterium]|nr:thiamine phosphate synthase [SAR324 cluster bacterium]